MKADRIRLAMEEFGHIPCKRLPVEEMHKQEPISEELLTRCRMGVDKQAEQRRFWERR